MRGMNHKRHLIIDILFVMTAIRTVYNCRVSLAREEERSKGVVNGGFVAIFALHTIASVLFLVSINMAPTPVPESVLRKRKRDEDWAAKKAASAAEVSRRQNIALITFQDARTIRNEIFIRFCPRNRRDNSNSIPYCRIHHDECAG